MSQAGAALRVGTPVQLVGASPPVFTTTACNCQHQHHAVEKHLQSGHLGWTILRLGFFAQNLASAYLEDIRQDSRIRRLHRRGLPDCLQANTNHQ
jgi:uncharacterized protein YbjT (DUF2867 family)